jgi:hypothetical protein
MNESGSSGFRALPALALACPAVVWLAAAAGLVMAAIAGLPVLSAPADLTLSEAAALRDQAEVVRLIRSGASPDARSRVRGGIIREHEYLLTPLEAATATRRGEIARLLVSHGATLDDSTFPVLICLAVGSEFEDMADVLRELAPGREMPSCDGIRMPL